MKTTKRILAALLAVVMVMALATSAFAAADLTGHAFTAYQIFKADTIDAEGTLGNITWGNGISAAGQAALLAKYEVTSVDALVAKLSAMENDSKAAREFAQEAYKYTTGDGTAVTSGTTTLPIGYYLIVDSTEPAEDAKDFVYNLSVLKVSDSKTPVTVTSKVDVPTVEKKIVEGDERVNINDASIGDDISYEITGTLPSNLADFETYYYCFTDTLSKGLTYNKDLVITVDGVDATGYFFVKDEAAVDNTKITVAIEDLLALNNVKDDNGNKVFNVTATSKIVLTYSAKLNENAVINGENPNEVDLKYSNNPDESGTPGQNPPPPPGDEKPEPEHPTGETPKDKVVTYTTELTVKKTDNQGNELTGAKFQLTGTKLNIVEVTGENFVPYVEKEGEATPTLYYELKNGTFTTTVPVAEDDEETKDIDERNIDDYKSTTPYVKEVSTWYETKEENVSAEAFVDEHGKLVFTGLGAGQYTLTEVVTPAGYNTIDPMTITVVFNENTKTFYIEELSEKDDDGKPTVFTMETTVVNEKGSTLPETGGIGTTLFYAIGGMLVVCAGVLLITKRRMISAQ